MPTIGQLNCFFGVFARAVCRGGLERTDFLRLDFVRESRAPLFGVRFTAMALFDANSGLPITQVLIAI
jgi:hypothetical protein